MLTHLSKTLLSRQAQEYLSLGDWDNARILYQKLCEKISRSAFQFNVDMCYRNDFSNLEDVTAIVKTFQRPDCLERLLLSIRTHCTGLKIIVVDDSPQPNDISDNFPEIIYSWVGFDKGLSYGRNEALRMVKTKYLVLLDDDFIFTSSTDIKALLRLVSSNSVDILGGMVREEKGLMNYYSDFSVAKDVLTQTHVPAMDEEITYCDIVLNFFVARTHEVRRMGGWDNRLKLAEHTEFFIRAKKFDLRVGYSGLCVIDHFPVRDSNYAPFRSRGKFFTDVMMFKYCLKKIINVHGQVYTRTDYKDKTPLAVNEKMLYHKENIADSIIADIFQIGKENELPFFLSNGTLLGCIREKGYISHDSDLDVGLISNHYKPEIIELFRQKGFEVFHEFGTPENGYEISLLRNGVKIDVFFYYVENDFITMSVWDGVKQIKYNFSPFSLVSWRFREVDVLIPFEAEKYLVEQYGSDWRKPKIEWDWKKSPHNMERV